jgi:hypothetical protein
METYCLSVYHPGQTRTAFSLRHIRNNQQIYQKVGVLLYIIFGYNPAGFWNDLKVSI